MHQNRIIKEKLEKIYSLIWKDLNSWVSKTEIEKAIIKAIGINPDSFTWAYNGVKFDFAIMDLARAWDYNLLDDIRVQDYQCIFIVWGYLKKMKAKK